MPDPTAIDRLATGGNVSTMGPENVAGTLGIAAVPLAFCSTVIGKAPPGGVGQPSSDPAHA
jgi:hypothetical protein